MGRIRATGLAAVLLLGVAVTGCAGFDACPAIGWINAVNIELDGNAEDAAAVELCVDGVCAAAAPLLHTPDGPLTVATSLPTDAASSTDAPTSSPLIFSVERIDERSWRATVDMSTPDTLTVRAVSADGTVLAEREAPLEWERVGGTERCGGPSEGTPIRLDIPF